MTEDNAPQPADTTDTGIPPLSETAAPPPVKKAPLRRKAAVRVPKAADVGTAEGDGAADGTDGKLAPKAVRRPRRVAVKADAEAPADAREETAPTQPPVLSPEAMERSDSAQAHIETQVISPDAYQALQKRTERIFGRHDGTDASPAPTPPVSETPPAAIPEAPPAAPVEAAPPVSSPLPVSRPMDGASAMPPQNPRGNDFRPQQDRPPFEQRPQQYPQQDGQGRHGGRQDRFERRERHGGGQQSYQQQQGYNDRQQGGFNRHQPQGGNNPAQQDHGGQPQNQGMDGNVVRVAEPQFGEGIVEVSGKGFGFLREAKRNFVQTPADVFVTPEVCRKYNLRDGQWIKGEVRRSSRGPQLFRLTALNGEDPEKFRNLPNFDELTSINPKKRIRLETVPERYTTRVMDLMAPVGKGQRGLIVAPPRTGKTTLLQHIGEAVIKNHPEMKLIILLVDERPEEVTEIRRTVPQAEIMASSNDSDLKNHTRIAQLAMERCKRLVEAGFDVFMLLDSITRVGRAFNNASTGGRTMSGGMDSRALEIPRKIFAAARNTEEAGSLTIMATALIETGSRMDDLIFQEFKGTGNMELVLDRKISDQRIYPAVDIFQSGTRREELLLQGWELDKINVIRRGLAGHKPLEAIERLLSFLKKFPTNAQMLTSLPG